MEWLRASIDFFLPVDTFDEARDLRSSRFLCKVCTSLLMGLMVPLFKRLATAEIACICPDSKLRNIVFLVEAEVSERRSRKCLYGYTVE